MNTGRVITLFFIFFLQCLSQIDIKTIMSQKSRRPPTENSSSALDVRLGMYLESLGDFRSSEMSFDVDLYVYMSWRDTRLAHNYTDYVLINDDSIRKQMWRPDLYFANARLPDLYFANARQASFQEVTVPNFNMFVAPDGTIAYSCRCTLTVACSLDLRFYPMDQQLCSIRVLSYAYIAKQVNVTWFTENAIRFNPEIGLPEFQIEHVERGYCNGTYRYAMTNDAYKVDDFSCLTGNLYLSRSIGYNLVQSYIPTGLIVMISWVSFWIDRRAVPARVTLSFTTLVSLTTLGNGLRFGLPQVSYAKAIDLWYGACMLFVFCALLEFATINSYMRKSEKFDGMAKKLQFANINGKNNSSVSDEMEFKEDWYTRENGNGTSKSRMRKISQYNPEPVEDLLSEKIKFIDHDMDFKQRKDDKSAIAMSIYDNVSCNEDLDGRGSDEETQFGGKEKHVRYIDRSLKHQPNESLLVATYLQISANHSRHALNIDKTCRYLFPLTFLGWNAFYWWYYLVFQKIQIIK